jgi:dGTPase
MFDVSRASCSTIVVHLCDVILSLERVVAIDDPDEDAKYQEAVRSRIQAALRAGYIELNDVLRECEGADPALVASILKQLTRGKPKPSSQTSSLYDALDSLSLQLPAPDPSRSQWWFSSAGLAYLSGIVETRVALFESQRILCLGTPTLGALLAHRRFSVDILDIDEQVLEALRPVDTNAVLRSYDAADELPTELSAVSQVAVVDPPWYPAAIYTFLNRALTSLVAGGEILCTLPGRLTRPGIETLRAELIRDLVSAGHEIIAVERGSVQYQVPRFEVAALERLEGFQGIPWRAGDLLHARKVSLSFLPEKALSKKAWHVFSRRPSEFRVFSQSTAQADRLVIAKELPKYSKNISTRAYPDEDADIWSTEKTGIQVGDIGPIHAALEAWARGADRSATIDQLVGTSSRDYAAEVVDKLERIFSLWSRFAAEPPLRLDVQIETARLASLSNWATKPSPREHQEPTDVFRGPYQRDRDRILWSAGLRRLSNKTQLFPVEHDDDLRQRLTHSIEVFQLASTIGISFGLDGALIEAGALAHDIGHTPFGHAGEHALDKLLNLINPELGGFNHYEHGVDVVRYLEGPYHVSAATAFAGLNLTPELSECILKHTYCHSGESFASEELIARSKHGDIIKGGYCHLEGQAVRIADKISYLISDIEDGIRLGALSQQDLLSCRFFHRPPLDFSAQSIGSLSQQFAQQRRWVLKVLMEDVLQASSRRLARCPSQSRESVRNAESYLIQHSDDMLADVAEIWKRLQVGRLHSDRRVVSANLHAARVVAELAVAYSVMPHLIEERFRQEHARLSESKYMRFYRDRVGRKVSYRRDLVGFLPMHVMIGTNYNIGADITVDIADLIMAKDYVAALSDSRAKLFHRQMVEGRP